MRRNMISKRIAVAFCSKKHDSWRRGVHGMGWKDIDFAEAAQIQQRLGLRIDWMRRLGRLLSESFGRKCDVASGAGLARAIAEFECEMGIEPTGIVACATRKALIAQFESLGVRWIGPNLESGVLFSWQTEATLYERYCENVERLDGAWMRRDYALQLVGLRGVRLRSRCLERTDSAMRFAQSAYGDRQHLSADKPDYFDSAMGLFWVENGVKHAQLYRCVVNPASVWAQGTAHLNNGQYAYGVGRHRTRDSAHIDAVRRYADISWDKSWIYDDSGDSVQYIALVGTSPIEVVRSTGASLDVSDADIARAESAFADRTPEYVDAQKIRINIHSCAENKPSSLGCQNIAPEDYASLMSTILRLTELQKRRYGFELPIEYFLSDGSWFE